MASQAAEARQLVARYSPTNTGATRADMRNGENRLERHRLTSGMTLPTAFAAPVLKVGEVRHEQDGRRANGSGGIRNVGQPSGQPSVTHTFTEGGSHDDGSKTCR